METNDLISVLMGEYGPLFNTIEMWACMDALGVKPMRNSETGQWYIRYGSIYGSGKTIYEATSDFYKRIVNG